MTDASDTLSAWSAAADPARAVGHAVEFHPSLGSTNDRAREALGELGGAGRAIVADLQTAGRGRRGRTWASPPGVNLMVSVGLRPQLAGPAVGWLGIAAALATRDACETASGAEGLRIRWPNDIVEPDGAKLAGLLVETVIEDGRLAEAIVGVGINANWHRSEMPPDIATRATSLADLAGAEVDRVTLLGALLAALDREVGALERGESPVPRLRAVSALQGRRVEVAVGEERIEGLVAGIGDDGSLLLETSVGRIALAMGEVERVEDAGSAEPAASAVPT